jgi:hypothetical protein
MSSSILCCSVDSIYAFRVGHVHRARYTQTNNYQQELYAQCNSLDNIEGSQLAVGENQ